MNDSIYEYLTVFLYVVGESRNYCQICKEKKIMKSPKKHPCYSIFMYYLLKYLYENDVLWSKIVKSKDCLSDRK